MRHPMHTGRYSGAATIPATTARPKPAAALVLHYLPMRRLDPLFAQLDAYPEERAVGEVRLVPVQAVDFYALRKPA